MRHGELTSAILGAVERMEAACGLARQMTTSYKVRRWGEQPRKQGEIIKRSGEINYHQEMLGNLLGSMERLPTMVTAATCGRDILIEIQNE